MVLKKKNADPFEFKKSGDSAVKKTPSFSGGREKRKVMELLQKGTPEGAVGKRSQPNPASRNWNGDTASKRHGEGDFRKKSPRRHPQTKILQERPVERKFAK